MRYRDSETRDYLRSSLKTRSIEIAGMRRDSFEVADNVYSQALSLEIADAGDYNERIGEIGQQKYKSVCSRAIALGFVYKPTQDLIGDAATLIKIFSTG